MAENSALATASTYSFENNRTQTFHESGCMHAHDPRLQCLRLLTKFHSYFKIVWPSLISDERINPKPQLLNIKGNQIVNLPDIVLQENYDTLEWDSLYFEDKLIYKYNENDSKENSKIIGSDQLHL